MVKHKPIKGKRSLKNEKNYKFNHVGGHSRAAICTFYSKCFGGRWGTYAIACAYRFDIIRNRRRYFIYYI